MATPGPYRLTIWRALQLHHYLQSLPNPQGVSRNLTTFEEYCSDGGTLPQVLSKTYNLLITLSEPTELSCLKHWETDLCQIFKAWQRQNIIKFSLKSSICTKLQETNDKILMRWYSFTTTYILPHNHFGDVRREEERCSIYFGPAPKLNHFWRKSGELLRSLLMIPDDLTFFLLHVSKIPEKMYKKINYTSLVECRQSLYPLELEKFATPHYQLLAP